MREWSHLVCGVVIIFLPSSVLAQDPTRGLLYNNGGTWLNQAPAPPVAAIFPDSLVQTQRGFTARIDVPASTVTVQSETVAQFQGHELALEHGTLHLTTVSALEVIVGCITVTPLTSDRTDYTVTDIDGKVNVTASKNDVKIQVHGGTLRKAKPEKSFDIIVHEGQQATRQEHCAGALNTKQVAAQGGALLNDPWAVGTAGAIVAVIACLGLCHGDDPLSPSKP